MLSKPDAGETYKTAISKQNGAYLLELKSVDIFEISVGNLPPNARVQITIDYVLELDYIADDQIQLAIPGTLLSTHQRHKFQNETSKKQVQFGGFGGFGGTVSPVMPAQTQVEAEAQTEYKGKVNIAVSMSSEIEQLVCVSHVHTAVCTAQQHIGHLELVLGHRESKDLVLNITVKGLHQPSLLLERHPTRDTLAVLLSYVRVSCPICHIITLHRPSSCVCMCDYTVF